ncbi:Uncharacterized protein TCM_043014 [Theobroma cacao]|uniref:Uncharacterized protein n=1 Tax=Theobroma cacao TaxID=3641 RepID=A0A061FP09_THECC|nr:Uncharacterized protein TCM_043014 [Theobroma cacao]
MTHSRQGSAPKDTRRRLGKQDEEYRQRHSSQMHTSSENNQDEDFSEGHSPRMEMSSENKNQQQPHTNGAPFWRGDPSKDIHPKESNQSSGHSQQQTTVTSPQGYPPIDDQSSYPLHQQQSSTKISTSQEYNSKDDSLPKTQSAYHTLQQQLSAGATSVQEQPSKTDSSYNPQHQLPSGRVYSHPKDDSPQRSNQSSYHSTQQSYPVSDPPTNNHPRQSNQSSYQSRQQPSPVPTPQRCDLSEDSYTVRDQNSEHLQQQQQSDCLQGEPPKQVHPPKHSAIPMTVPSNTSCMQQDKMNDNDPHRSQTPSSKDPSAQGYAAPPKAKEDENVATQKYVATPKVESTPRNIAVPRTNLKPPSKWCCCL